MCYHQITLFTVSKDEWNTKEGTGKSMKNTLYVLWYAKGHLSTLNNKNIALTTIELSCLKASSGS